MEGGSQKAKLRKGFTLIISTVDYIKECFCKAAALSLTGECREQLVLQMSTS